LFSVSELSLPHVHPLHSYRNFIRHDYWYATLMTCPCRLMAYVSKECNLVIIYLSPIHMSQRLIVGYKLEENHPELVDLTRWQREAYRKKSSAKQRWAWQCTYYAQWSRSRKEQIVVSWLPTTLGKSNTSMYVKISG
jgi:hypothetical protein